MLFSFINYSKISIVNKLEFNVLIRVIMLDIDELESDVGILGMMRIYAFEELK